MVSFYSDTTAIEEKVESERVFVDGKRGDDVGNVVLRDRKHLSEDGMVVIIIGMNKTTGGIIYGLDIVSRVFVFEDESQEYLETARCIVVEAVNELSEEMRCNCEEDNTSVRQVLRLFFKKSIVRRPVILPVIKEI